MSTLGEHYPECEDQDPGSACICEALQEAAEIRAFETAEAYATGN